MERSGEGAERKLTILTTVQFGGRPGELPHFCLDKMYWDRMHRFPVHAADAQGRSSRCS